MRVFKLFVLYSRVCNSIGGTYIYIRRAVRILARGRTTCVLSCGVSALSFSELVSGGPLRLSHCVLLHMTDFFHGPNGCDSVF